MFLFSIPLPRSNSVSLLRSCGVFICAIPKVFSWIYPKLVNTIFIYRLGHISLNSYFFLLISLQKYCRVPLSTSKCRRIFCSVSTMRHFKDFNWNRCISSTIIYSISRKSVSSKSIHICSLRECEGVGAECGWDGDWDISPNVMCARQLMCERWQPMCDTHTHDVIERNLRLTLEMLKHIWKQQRSASANSHLEWNKMNATLPLPSSYLR